MFNQKMKIDALFLVRDALSAKDQEFATSLINQADRRELSDKQMFWVEKLTARGNGEQAEPKAEQVGDMAGVIALFDKAKKHLKYPAIVLRASSEITLRFNVASAQARVPGSVNVVNYGSRAWYGRVQTNGRFEPSTGNPAPAEVVEAIKRFACDPAGVAAEHGRLTGNCCFCNIPLTDERSTAVGYGPVCAKNWGLPWGAKAVKAA